MDGSHREGRASKVGVNTRLCYKWGCRRDSPWLAALTNKTHKALIRLLGYTWAFSDLFCVSGNRTFLYRVNLLFYHEGPIQTCGGELPVTGQVWLWPCKDKNIFVGEKGPSRAARACFYGIHCVLTSAFYVLMPFPLCWLIYMLIPVIVIPFRYF